MQKKLCWPNHVLLLTAFLIISCFFSLASFAHASLAKKVIGNLVYWDQARGFQDIQNNVGTLSEVSPDWYFLNAKGDVLPFVRFNGTPYVDTSIILYLKTNNIRVLPMIQNVVNGDWNSAVVSTVINDPILAAKHLSNIVNLVVSAGYDGIDIDYEDLPATDRAAFSNFIRDLAAALHAQNKLLSVNVYAKTGEPGYWNGPQSQDWSVIGAETDEVRIMLYGYSWQTSPAGPVAPINWVNDVLAFAESALPSQKIIQGIPTYGLDWPAGSPGTEHVWDEFIAIANTYAASIKWDSTSMSAWFQYTSGGVQHTAWFENASSTEAKLDLNNVHNAAGIFIWRLGGEDAGIWNAIRSKFGGSGAPSAPTADIKAGGLDTSITIPSNTSTIISWTSSNTDSCLVSPTGWTGISNAGISTGNLSTSTTYTLSCSGPGGSAADNVVVNVTPPQVGDMIAPTVSITEPVSGSVATKRVRINVAASDNVQVTKVLIFTDGKLLSTDTSAPYFTYWNTQKISPGAHTIQAIAHDAAGNTSQSQITVIVK